MPATNPMTEAKGLVTDLSSAGSALTKAISRPAAGPYREAITGWRDEITQAAISIQEQAMANPLASIPQTPNYGMEAPLGTPPMNLPPGPGASEGALNPEFAQAMLGGLNG